MTYSFKGVRIFLLVIVSMLLSPSVLAAEEDDVLKTVQSWADLENDLEAQAALIRDDRIQIFNMTRVSDQAINLKDQVTRWKAVQKKSPGTKLLIRIESPIIRVYDNTAVASFVRYAQAIPGDDFPRSTNAAFMTMVLVKERGDWKIAHLHGSTRPN